MTSAQGGTLSSALIALLRRDLRLAMRRRSEVLTPVLFLIMVATLFPLGMGPDIKQLAAIAPGVIWVAALLAALLSLNQLFHADLRDGTLEQLIISRWPLPALVSVKVLAHWLVSGLPLAVVARGWRWPTTSPERRSWRCSFHCSWERRF